MTLNMNEVNDAPALRMIGIRKCYGNLLANDNVSLELGKSEVLGLLGENGAGKTTLMQVLFGLIEADDGEIYIQGKRVDISNPRIAAHHGVGMVHQHFSLSPELTVTENVVLGEEPSRFGLYDYKRAENEVKILSERIKLDVDLRDKVKTLSVANQQKVEIMKALYRGAQILILDEPTASLAPQSVGELFQIIRKLSSQGIAVIFITHKLKEVLSIADRLIILRAGKIVGQFSPKGITENKIARLMVGHEVEVTPLSQRKIQKPKPVLRIQNAELVGDRDENILRNINLSVNQGEILGVAGVAGNGQEELEKVIIGLNQVDAGTIIMGREEITTNSPRERLEKGLWFIPPDRHKQGLVLSFPLTENLILGSHWLPPVSKNFFLQPKHILQITEELIERFSIRASGPRAKAQSLSGGNQQKLVVARSIGHKPKLLLASQPTRGIDVVSTEYVHQELLKLREAGGAIVLISFDLDELLKLSDRIVVIFQGEIVLKVNREEFDKEEIGLFMIRGANAEGSKAAMERVT